MSPMLHTSTPGSAGTSSHAAAACAPAARRGRPGRAASAARSRCARRRPTRRRRRCRAAPGSGRSGTARSGRPVRCRSNQSAGSPSPTAMPRISASATRSQLGRASRASPGRGRPAGGEQVGAVQRRAGDDPRVVGGCSAPTYRPSLRSGRPDVSSPPTGNQPRHAGPAFGIAIACLASSGRARRTRVPRRRSGPADRDRRRGR